MKIEAQHRKDYLVGQETFIDINKGDILRSILLLHNNEPCITQQQKIHVYDFFQVIQTSAYNEIRYSFVVIRTDLITSHVSTRYK